MHNKPQEDHPRLNKLLHKLSSVNITDLKQITLTPDMQLMNHNEYRKYHGTSTKLLKNALDYTKQLFCSSLCQYTCNLPCLTHTNKFLLKDHYTIPHHTIHPRIQKPPTHPPSPPPPSLLKPPNHIIKTPSTHPISHIITHELALP